MIKDINFLSLASGSNGNCYYFSNGPVSFLIDFGISVKRVKKELSTYDIELEDVDFVLITHDHIDHIKFLGSLVHRYNKPICTTVTLHNKLSDLFFKKYRITHHPKLYLESESEYCYEGVKIIPIPVPHDATENFAYYIDFGEVSVTIATDVGLVTSTLLQYMLQSDHIIIESNYDAQMLNEGRYPKVLIDRISNGSGHLSNDDTADAIRESYHTGLQSIYLCHLSSNNNTPQKAVSRVGGELLKMGVLPGVDINLEALPRGKASKMYKL